MPVQWQHVDVVPLKDELLVRPAWFQYPEAVYQQTLEDWHYSGIQNKLIVDFVIINSQCHVVPQSIVNQETCWGR